MSYYLDTNTCIYALKGIYPSIERKLRGLTPDSIKIPSLVKAELLFGCEKSQRKKRTRDAVEVFLFPFEVVPFCAKAAEHYAEIRSRLEKKGLPIGPNDLIIAATVAANRGVLVTHNVKEFRRIGKLKVEDWT